MKKPITANIKKLTVLLIENANAERKGIKTINTLFAENTPRCMTSTMTRTNMAAIIT